MMLVDDHHDQIQKETELTKTHLENNIFAETCKAMP